MMADVGDIIVRGGNPLDPGFGQGPARRAGGSIDHISFGIAPWDTDGVKEALEKRGLRAQIDTSSRHLGPDGTYVPDEIHTAALRDLLEEHGAYVGPGHWFERPDTYFRLGYGWPTERDLEAGLAAISAAL